MSRAKLHLPTLPVAAGLLLSLGALACSDKRDDANTRNSSEAASVAVDTPATTTTVQGGTVEPTIAAAPNTSTRTTTSRSARRSNSTPIERYDPYASDPAAPRREESAVAIAPVSPATPAPDAAKAEVTARAEVRTPVSADSASVTVTTPTATVTTTPPTATVVTTPPTATVTTTPPTATVVTTPPTATVVTTPPTATVTTTPPTATPTPTATVTTPTAIVSTPTSPTGVTIVTRDDASPAKSVVLNDAHLFNIILLANAGDSARTAAVLGAASEKPTVVATVVNPVTPVTVAPKGEVAVTTPAPTGEVRVITRSEGGTVTRGETSALFPLGEDCYWPTMNRHDDPKLKPECEDNPVQGPVAYQPAPAVTAAPVTNAETVRIGQPQPMTPKTDGAVSTPVAGSLTAEQVREIAAQMQRDHTQLNSRTATVLQRLNVAPSESAVSVEVYNRNQRTGEQTLAVGNERAWLENEVRLHEQSLATVNDRLLPSANDAELRQVLEEQKRLIEQHLTVMRQLLGNAAANQAAPVNHDMHVTPPDSMRMRTDTVQLRYDPNPPRRP